MFTGPLSLSLCGLDTMGTVNTSMDEPNYKLFDERDELVVAIDALMHFKLFGPKSSYCSNELGLIHKLSGEHNAIPGLVKVYYQYQSYSLAFKFNTMADKLLFMLQFK